MKVLVMGLPGSGKTYLTERLVPLISAAWYNADKVREMANDWDFSDEGRDRQSKRMRTFADFEKSHGRFVVCDFVCPTKATRENFDADIVVWMDTIKEGRFEDTNKLFQNPEKVDFHITEWNEHNHDAVAKKILQWKKQIKKRHLAKTLTWRILATTDTFLIAWIITGNIDWAAGIAGIEVLTKMILYYWHERVWYKHIKFGVKNV